MLRSQGLDCCHRYCGAGTGFSSVHFRRPFCFRGRLRGSLIVVAVCVWQLRSQDHLSVTIMGSCLSTVRQSPPQPPVLLPRWLVSSPLPPAVPPRNVFHGVVTSAARMASGKRAFHQAVVASGHFPVIPEVEREQFLSWSRARGVQKRAKFQNRMRGAGGLGVLAEVAEELG